jgi:hypothetical protein
MNRLRSALSRLPRGPLAVMAGALGAVPLAALAGSFGLAEHVPVADAPWQQVRILERFSIRISPGAPMPPQMRFELEQDRARSRIEERRMAKCVSAGQIGAVQSTRDNRLVFYMRDQRVIVANLEKACRSSEYYSGFYMARSADGQLCLDRDVLQSRSGASCKVKRWRELVDADEH